MWKFIFFTLLSINFGKVLCILLISNLTLSLSMHYLLIALDDETINVISNKFILAKIPTEEILREEFLYYKEIFAKALNKEWIVLSNSWRF